ncbi:MAG TPA: DinB family protein [Blastocatellia bacterium]|nr:DinB family protein [Blastocatellia bacterium]
MSSMTAEQSLFLRDFLLPAIEGEFATTKKVLAAVPDERADYRPDPKYRTARELAWHIVASELYFLEGIAKGSFEGGGEEPPNPTKSMAELIALYENGFRAGLEKVSQLGGEQLAKPINFFQVFNRPAVAYLTFLKDHTVHHRGQLSAYLRPMGAKVPAIYGPSGDEMWEAGEAASA